MGIQRVLGEKKIVFSLIFHVSFQQIQKGLGEFWNLAIWYGLRGRRNQKFKTLHIWLLEQNRDLKLTRY